MTQQGQGDVVALLPCPFCGGEVMRREALWPSEGDTDGIIHVNPGDCPLHRATPDFSLGFADGCRSVSDGWNRRTLSSSSGGEQGWRTIDSAPKDGTWFLICRDDEGPESYEVGCFDPQIWKSYEPAENGLYRQVEKVVDECGFNNFHRATHWMPLPSAPGSVPTSLAGQGPDGYMLVPKEPTLEVERSIAYAVAVARQGASSTPRFESPTEYDIDTARAWVRWVVAALSERFSVPPPRDGHSRDCEYVTTDGPAPCTCGFVERDCNAAVARAALQSSPQPTAGGDAPADREMVHFLHSVVRNALQWHEDHRVEVQKIGPGTIPQWVLDGWTVIVAAPLKLKSDALSAERARVIEAAIVAIKKARRTKIVGPESLTRAEHRLWDKTRYDTFKEAEAALRALGQQDTGETGDRS